MLDNTLLIISVVLFIIVVVLVGYIVVERRTRRLWQAEQQRTLADTLQEEHQEEITHSLKIQRGGLHGKLFERFALWHDDSPYNLFDVYSVPNAPIDFIAFVGLEDSDGQKCTSVDLIDFKSGKRRNMTPKQLAIKKCVAEGTIRFCKVSDNKDGSPYIVNRQQDNLKKMLHDIVEAQQEDSMFDPTDVTGEKTFTPEQLKALNEDTD
jgi:predicted Holliday junction resolvase-like endonuclease